MWGAQVGQAHVWVPIYSSDNYAWHQSLSTSHSYHGDQVSCLCFQGPAVTCMITDGNADEFWKHTLRSLHLLFPPQY